MSESLSSWTCCVAGLAHFLHCMHYIANTGGVTSTWYNKRMLYIGSDHIWYDKRMLYIGSDHIWYDKRMLYIGSDHIFSPGLHSALGQVTRVRLHSSSVERPPALHYNPTRRWNFGRLLCSLLGTPRWIDSALEGEACKQASSGFYYLRSPGQIYIQARWDVFIIYDSQDKSGFNPGEFIIYDLQVNLHPSYYPPPGWFLPWECNLICCTSQAKGSRTLTLAARQVCSGHTHSLFFVLCIGSQSDITLKSILISCLPCLLVASSMKLFSFW